MTQTIVNAENGTYVVISNGVKIDRSKMKCTPAQMRVALHRMGELSNVQVIADSNPEASIVWEYATEITRNSPFISALASGHYTDDKIDAMFLAASEIVL